MTNERHAELIEQLHALGAVKFGQFTLKSGASSPIYIDLRLMISDPKVLALAAKAYAELLAGLDYDRLAAIPMAGVPIGTAVSLETGEPMIFPRQKVKAYGTSQAIEGHHAAGETVVVLDDLISNGGSKIEAIEPLAAAGLVVKDVVVLIDRQGGGAEMLAEAGYRLYSVLTLPVIVDVLAAKGRITDEQRRDVLEFIGATQTVTEKRTTTMPKLTIAGHGTVEVPAGKRLVLAIEEAGVDILHRCGGWAKCTTCRVEFADGEPGKMTQAEKEKLEEQGNLGKFRLSCQCLVEDDMSVTPLMRLSETELDDAGSAPAEAIEPEVEWVDAT